MSFFKKKYVMVGEDKDLNEKVNKLESLVAFLCRYNRDEVVLKEECCNFGVSLLEYRGISAVYIANDEVKEARLGTYHKKQTAEITFNGKKVAVVRIGEDRYMIDKSTGTVSDITDLYCETFKKGGAE